MPAPNISRFYLKAAGQDFKVTRWTGEEKISSLFRFDVEFISDDANLNLQDFIGKTAQLTMAWDTLGPEGEEKQRKLYGMVLEARQKKLSDIREQGHDYLYSVTIVPRLQKLKYRTNCRIFQKLNTDDIIREVLKDHGIQGVDFKARLQTPCWKREYCVQYRESDFDFVSRLLEEEGIAYCFEFKDNKDIFVIINFPFGHTPCDEESQFSYHRASQMDINQRFVFSLGVKEALYSGQAAHDEFNFTKPRKDLFTKKKGKKFPSLELYDYPSEYVEKAEGEQVSQYRMEEAGSLSSTVQGESNCFSLSAGRTMELKDHYREEANRKYLILSVTHEGDQTGGWDGTQGKMGYANTFEAIPADVRFRPARKTPWPVVEGPQTALVVGPSGEEIYVDEHGRVKVQFHWDRDGQYDEKSSCWIRVSQTWAGGKYGFFYCPRIGHEVIVDFLEGNPDRPIITGCVYNAETPPPYGLPGEKTKSVQKTKTYKGEGANELRFEDKPGSEQIFLHAQKELNVRVKENEINTVEGSRHFILKKSHFQSIGGSEHQTVDGDKLHVVKKKFCHQVGMDVDEDFSLNQKTKVGMSLSIVAGMEVVIEASLGITLKVGGNFVKIDPTGVTILGTLVKINSGGAPSTAQAVQTTDPEKPKEAEKTESGFDVTYP